MKKSIQISEEQLSKIIAFEQTVNDKGDVNFGDNENYELVRDYIADNMVGSKQGAGNFSDYYLPLDAKEYFDFIGWVDYSMFRVDNPNHPDYGKKFIEVPSFIL